ncbi:hypothetical protein LKO27_11550 [Tessaracoccus sp. OS52]|uniref:hypothetical protein n=1 Tax=Tessaracoccus sp. OS52 TaxID=2886691 RepID=UPI001D12A894|nr:hypothetical protein [Tessaracoccus sp. OS52]MCC2594040.1 hypothetical protein [Tessaracoccus sp. OS52]
MSAATERRARRAARRAELDGSGPVREERAPEQNPGAVGKFGLFAEVLQVGLLVSLVGLLVVTLPAGLAAGVRHLRRFVAAEDSSMSLFWDDVKRALLPGAAVGAVFLALVGVLLLDINLARSGLLPGGVMVEVVGWVGLAVLAVALLAAAGAWNPADGWRGALRRVPGLVVADVPGALYLLATAGFVVIVTWALFPLLLPALGCAALAVVAIPGRPRRQR